MRVILQVLVGSHAHGLETEESDRDYFQIFQTPTQHLLKIMPEHFQKGDKLKTFEGDVTSHEMGRFLYLACKSNPTIIEVFRAPIIAQTPVGEEMLNLFPFIWSRKGVRNAFMGYSLDQHKRFLTAIGTSDHRRFNKAAATRLRMLYNGTELLTTGDFTIRIADTPMGETVRRFKLGQFDRAEYDELSEAWGVKLQEAYENSPDKHTDFDAINKFLLKSRKEFWE